MINDMSEGIPNQESNKKIEETLLSETVYEADQSPEFDEHLKSRKHLRAWQRSFSPESADSIQFSDWHMPCHSILTHTADGMYQIFHVQPNNPGATLLSFDQEQTLKKLGDRDTEAVVVKGSGSWFDAGDGKELEKMGIKVRQIVDVESKPWRMLYDPITNEIWVDIREQKVLKKYKGF